MSARPEPPVSRRERKKERTRQEIFAAAMKLFAKDSYDGVTVDAICARADVARATFFAHFPTKASLLFECGRRVADAWHASDAAGATSCTEQLDALVGLIVDGWYEQPEVMGAMVREHTLAPARPTGETHDLLPLPILVTDIIERGRKAGEFREGLDARIVGRMLLSNVVMSLALSHRGRRLAAGALRDQLLDLVLRGLADASPPAAKETRP